MRTHIWKNTHHDNPLRANLEHESRLVVRATQDVLDQDVPVTWTRESLQPTAPLRLVYWALSSWNESQRLVTRNTEWHELYDWFVTVLRVGIIILPLHLLFLMQSAYTDQHALDIMPLNAVPRRPRYTRNELEMDYRKHVSTVEPGEVSNGASELFKATRLVLPRRLMIYADKAWILVKDPLPTTEYVFISWHWASFGYDKQKPRKGSLSAVKNMAQHATLEAGLKAYWLDVQCITGAKSDGSFSSDVYGMADIVRNAHHVAILLPDEHSFYKREWARRLWTLPEGLLAKGRLRIWTATPTRYLKNDLDRVEMTYDFWHPFDNDERRFPTRILAEYFEGQIELSRIELVVTSIVALSRQDSSDFTQADVAYALMGLLRSKIEVSKEDTLFQAMAKLLSLTGDNEYVIERMLLNYPTPGRDCKGAFKSLLDKDQFRAHLWDIWPKGEVVGVDEQDGVVFLNDCRTLPINHQSLSGPTHEITHEIQPFLKPTLLLLGSALCVISLVYQQQAFVVCISIVCLTLLSACSGDSVTRTIADSHFMLIEGTLPLSDLELTIYGRRTSTLVYTTNSTPLNTQYRNSDPPWTKRTNIQRWTHELYSARATGEEPDWIRPPRQGMSPTSPGEPTSPISPLLRRTSSLPQPPRESYHPPLFPGHYLFTLIDTCSGAVSLIQAKRPPTTLLLGGTEGGMLRAVLCSSIRDQDGLQILRKEAVVRLNPDLWEQGTPRSWLRVTMMAG